jgi:hypothetical protein
MEWISISDELPEQLQPIFISDGFIVSKGKLIAKEFLDDYNEEYIKVTHWMPIADRYLPLLAAITWTPLPEPPK